MIRGLFLGGLSLLSLLFFSSACADLAAAQATDDERARAYFEAGTEAYAEEDFDEALSQFRRSYALSGRPQLLYNIGQAAERAGELDVAVDSFQEFLDRVQESPKRREVQRNLPILERQLARETRGDSDSQSDEDIDDTSDEEIAAAIAPDRVARDGADSEGSSFEEPSDEGGSIFGSPVFWIVAVALIAGGVVATLLLLDSEDTTEYPAEGSLGFVNALREQL